MSKGKEKKEKRKKRREKRKSELSKPVLLLPAQLTNNVLFYLFSFNFSFVINLLFSFFLFIFSFVRGIYGKENV